MRNTIDFRVHGRFISRIARILFRYFVKIKGSDNCLIVRLNSNLPVWKLFLIIVKLLRIQISGSNNKIELVLADLRSASITILGSLNCVSVHAKCLRDSIFLVDGADRCKISIAETGYWIRDAFFCVESDGGRISIGRDAHIMPQFYAVVNDDFEVPHAIDIGESVDIGMQTIMRTSDGHSIIDPTTRLAINEPMDVKIGNRVWIGARCVFLKGAVVPNHSIVGAMSLVSRSNFKEGSILAGVPAKAIRSGIDWNRFSFGKYMRKYKKETNELR